MEKLINKANILKILTAYYCEPDPEIFWDKELHKILIDNANAIDQEIYELAANIVQSLNHTDHHELLQEYSRIFLGPFEVIAHPYASVYLDGYTLNGETTQKILHFYNHCGLLFDEDSKDLPDNIVVIFQFLHYLAECEINGNDEFPNINWNEKRKEFLELFLNKWLPEFTEKIYNGTNNEFYKNLANFTRKFLEIV